MILALKILGGVIAFSWGVWLGLPGRYSQQVEDIEEVMDPLTPVRRRRMRRKRSLSPVAWLQRQPSVGTARKSRAFDVKAPDDR